MAERTGSLAHRQGGWSSPGMTVGPPLDETDAKADAPGYVRHSRMNRFWCFNSAFASISPLVCGGA